MAKEIKEYIEQAKKVMDELSMPEHQSDVLMVASMLQKEKLKH